MEKIYVSWENREIMDEEEYQEALARYLDERLESKCDMDEFLNDHYSMGELWLMTPEEREEVAQMAREEFTDAFIEEMDIETREFSITI